MDIKINKLNNNTENKSVENTKKQVESNNSSIFSTENTTTLNVSSKGSKIESSDVSIFKTSKKNDISDFSNSLSLKFQNNKNAVLDIGISDTLTHNIKFSDNIKNTSSLSVSVAARETDSNLFLVSNLDNNLFQNDFNTGVTIKGSDKLSFKPFNGFELYLNISGSTAYNNPMMMDNVMSDSSSDKPPVYGDNHNFKIEEGINFNTVILNKDNFSISNNNNLGVILNYANTLRYPDSVTEKHEISTGIKTALTFNMANMSDLTFNVGSQYTFDADKDSKTFKNNIGFKENIRPLKDNNNFKLYFGGDYSIQKTLTGDSRTTEIRTLSAGVDINKNVKLTGQYQNRDIKTGKKEFETETYSIGADVNLNKNVNVNGKININPANQEKNNLTIATKIKY